MHSRGEWSRDHNSLSDGKLKINTGLVDQRWSNINAFLPKTLTASGKQEGQFNKDLFLYVYSCWLRSHFPDVQTRTRMIVNDLKRGLA